jgi:hypothetical protein
MNKYLKTTLSTLAHPILAKVKKFKNIHKGESCYLIGGGISLKWFDLEAFSDKLCISCQYLPMHNDFSKLHTSYSFITEPYFFYPYMLSWKNSIQPIFREMMNKYISTHFFVHLSNYPVLFNSNVTFLFDRLEKCAEDKMLNFDNNDGSLNQAIKMAIYMGFESVYLVGFDYTHIPARNLHWIEKGQGEYIDKTGYNKFFFEEAKEKINITTVTLDGVSENIQSVTYEQYTGRKPIYKENIEILDNQCLKAFATWPGYKIF